MRALKTILAIVCGTTAFFFLVMSGSGGRPGMIGGLCCFALFALLTFLFARKTKADIPRIEKRRERSEKLAALIGGMMEMREPREADPNRGLKRVLVGATILNVVTFPFRVLMDLAKKQ